MRKSEWTKMACRTDRDKAAILSWFAPLCDDMVPEEAHVLCDIETDREKKLKVLMVDANGKRRWAIRTRGQKTFSITLKPVRQ